MLQDETAQQRERLLVATLPVEVDALGQHGLAGDRLLATAVSIDRRRLHRRRDEEAQSEEHRRDAQSAALRPCLPAPSCLHRRPLSSSVLVSRTVP